MALTIDEHGFQGRERYFIQREDGGFVAELWIELDASLNPKALLKAVRELFPQVIAKLEQQAEGRTTDD